jgi:hypothetical protein
MGEGIERLIPLSRAGDSMLRARLQAVLHGRISEQAFLPICVNGAPVRPRLRGRVRVRGGAPRMADSDSATYTETDFQLRTCTAWYSLYRMVHRAAQFIADGLRPTTNH